MQVTVETTQGLERRMRVDIPEARIKGEVDKRLADIARSARVPGFRPGRAPVRIIARRFGREVRGEVMGDILKESLVEALDQEELRPAATPRIAPVETDPGAGMSYTATFDVLPKVALPQFETMEIVRSSASVMDEDVDRMLELMRMQRRTWKTVERAALASDRLVLDLEGAVEGRTLEELGGTDLSVQLDTRQTIDGFEEALVGAQAGEERTVDVTLPESYQEHLAGKPATFRVKVHRVEEPELPDVDGAFAESYGIADGSVEVLLSEVRSNLERELAGGMRTLVKERVMNALFAAAREFDLPESMVREEMERAMARRRDKMFDAGLDPDQLDPAVFEEPVRRRVALDLLITEIIKQHGIELDHAKVRARVETIASTYRDPGAIFNWYYADRSRLAAVESLVFEDQVTDWVLERANVVDEQTSFDRIMNQVQTAAPAA